MRRAFLWILAVELIFWNDLTRLDLKQRLRRLYRACWSSPYSCLRLESVQLTVHWASLFFRNNSSCSSSYLRPYQHVLLSWTCSRTTVWHLLRILTVLTMWINHFFTVWCVFSFDQYVHASGSFFICQHDRVRLWWMYTEYFSFSLCFRWAIRSMLPWRLAI